MEHINNHRIRLYAVFWALSVLFLLLRLPAIGHPLVWDEAWGVLSLKAVCTGDISSPFFWYQGFHPPLYMAIGSFFGPSSPGIDIKLEFLSLMISYLLFCVTFSISARAGGRTMALFTGLFMCIMPQSMAYDTWIKSDNLASLFGYLALALLLRKRTLLAGISLGISLLSKENGAFFLITAVLCAPFLFEKNKLKGFLLLLTPCAIISGWWYVFFSNSSSNIVDFYFSKKIYGDIWSKPAWFYLAKLYNDIGPAGMIFFASGLSLSFIDALRKKYGVFPLTGLFLITYTFISVVFTTKTPWLSLSAYPAIAMISGYGAARVLSVGRKKVLAALTVGALTCWAMAGAAAYSYASYHSATYPNGWPGAVNSKKLAEYLNFTLKKGEKFVITDFSYWKTPVCPVFFFYSANMPEKIVPMASAPEDVARALKAEKAAYFIAVGIKGNKDLDRLTSFFDSKFGPPVNVAWAKVWRVRDI